MTGEEESYRLRAQRETLPEQLRDSAPEWSRLTLAEALLERTRRKFETERQPSVIRHAPDFFRHITDGAMNSSMPPSGNRRSR